jgi:uncharacterized membrane protein
MLAPYAVCVFPANVKHAFKNVQLPQLPSSWWHHGPRLALQPVIGSLAGLSSAAAEGLVAISRKGSQTLLAPP